MNIALAILATIGFLGAAAAIGRWIRQNESGRKAMIWPLRALGVLDCFLGALLLLAKPNPAVAKLAETQPLIGAAIGTGITLMLAGMLCVGLAGYSSAGSRP